MIVGVTGHRPDKLWGYGDNARPHEEKLEAYLKGKLIELGATEAVTGMALGVDTVFARADNIVLVSDCEYNSTVMQQRNEWMLDYSDVMIAVWDGSKGGTGNCVRYVKSKNKPIIEIRPFMFN